MNTRYEILAPSSGTWEHVGDEEFDTIEVARAAIEELQRQGFGTLAIQRVGERYPEILIEPIVMDTDGKALLWLETDADGNTTLNDTHVLSSRRPFDPEAERLDVVLSFRRPFDPEAERLDVAAVRWMVAVGMAGWAFRAPSGTSFTLTWSDDAILPEDWAEWCNSNGFRILSDGAAWGDDAYDYLANRLKPGMRIEDKDAEDGR